ncbi:cation/H(+) antiporter [Streptomyces sp. R302]|uniref:cation:proton antiporter n=1 Tax=unclassified Streptomyces TaxID=2593676 RepID=UPI00145CE4C2|nr:MULTISPECIES: cation:proton antiporter [unclassified Streptomyces]NML55450.1 cation/H(+) antiporter [Streptomyces sp. R301]NML79630.1 cation/H(+) antiporter [Streptomyces sp. R302]
MTVLAAVNPRETTQIAVMLADIAVVLVAGALLGRLARRFRQPAVVGEITAGILLGPSVLGLLPGGLTERLFPLDVRPLLSAVSQVGLILFMFVVGWEFERRMIKPHAKLAAGISVSSIAMAFGLGYALAFPLYPDHAMVAGHEIPFNAFATFLGAAMSVTAFPVLARILTENDLINTRVGSLSLASAAIDDVLAWCLLAYVSALVAADGNYTELARIGALSVLYVALMLLVVRPLASRLTWRLAATERWSTLLALLCAGALTSAWATTWIGIHAIFGAFMFGFVMPREPARLLVEHVRKPIDNVSSVLLPVFFIVTGLGVDLGALTGGDVVALGAIIAVACAGKLIGALIPARLAGMSWRDTKDLGLLMNTRGLTELIILNAAVSLGVLDGRMFTMLVIMALVTTAMAGPLLSRRTAQRPDRDEPAPEQDDTAPKTAEPAGLGRLRT